MANLYSDGNLVTSEVLAKEWGLRLADRAFIGNHPVLAAGYLGEAMGSAQITKTLASLGDHAAPSVAEGVAAAIVDYEFTEVSATVARKSTGRRVSDMLRSLDATGLVRDPVALTYDAATIYQQTLMAGLVAAGATATNDVGSTGVDLSWDVFLEAVHTVSSAEAEAEGMLAVLHPQQWYDLQRDMALTSGGLSDAMTHAREGYDALLARSSGYKGSYFGVDVYTSSKVGLVNTNADRRGFIAAKTGLVWAKAKIVPNAHRHEIILGGGDMQIAFDSDGSKFQQDAYFNSLLGTGLGVDAAVCTITSDA